MLTFVAQFIFLFNFFYSIFRGRKAPANPWNSNTLEWTTPINPGHGNWPGEIPKVYRWPYDYSKPVNEEYAGKMSEEELANMPDFIPQTVPYSETPETNLPHENDLINLEVKDDEGAIVIDTKKEE